MLEDIRQDKIRKMQNFLDKGIQPFPSMVMKKEDIKAVLQKEVGQPAKIAGRVMLFRDMGNITFMSVQDESSRMQVVVNKNEFAEDYKFWVKNLDMGDFVGVEGQRFDTQKGEKSILASKLTLLSKSILPMPDKVHGLEDEDIRQRFRELEMLANRNVLDKYRRRAQGTRVIREFMWQNGFSEIETPILQNVYGGTYAKPFMTHYNALDFDLYLRIAPEIFLKRATVGGFEKVFEIGKCFRNEGMGPAHLQEFTMFEFYWPYADYNLLMDYTEKMFAEVIEKVYDGKAVVKLGDNEINLKPPYPRIHFRELIKESLGVDFSELDSKEKVVHFVKTQGLEKEVNLEGKASWATMIDELYKKTVRKKIIQPIFVTDYPKEFMALAKLKADDPTTVSTFQLVVNTWELTKAYNELNDPLDQRQRFEEQDRLALEGEEEAMPYDHDFVESMEHGMPPMAGWGMGLDRFFALLEGQENLRDMVIFPTMKPKDKQNDLGMKNCEKANETMALGIDYAQAQALVEKYVHEKTTRLHLLESEAVMRELAKHFGQDEEVWGILGLLHDIDWDLTKDNTMEHCAKMVEIFRNDGASDFLIETLVSHGYGNVACGAPQDKQRSGQIQHCLAAAETVTGLIFSVSLMQPDKKLASVKLSSLLKKFKDKRFAANCNREIILECEKCGLTLEQFLEIALRAMQGIADKLEA